MVRFPLLSHDAQFVLSRDSSDRQESEIIVLDQFHASVSTSMRAKGHVIDSPPAGRNCWELTRQFHNKSCSDGSIKLPRGRHGVIQQRPGRQGGGLRKGLRNVYVLAPYRYVVRRFRLNGRGDDGRARGREQGGGLTRRSQAQSGTDLPGLGK